MDHISSVIPAANAGGAFECHMNGVAIVNDTRPGQLHFQPLHFAGDITFTTGQAGQTGSQSGIELFDVGRINTTNLSLGLNKQPACCAPISVG